MKLEQLLEGLDIISIQGQLDKNVTSLTSDSRKAGEGAMFVAVRGVTVDGHSFIPTLADKKPAAIVVEEIPAEIPEGATLVVVANTAIALGILASNWYGNPSSKLRLVGVTGTNGKTTTATLIYEMARLMGHKAGLLSTVVNYVDTEAVHASQTTPDPITINSLLARMVEAGCEYAAMEVSSHAADQHRIAGLTFAGGVFTNLTRDHLDRYGFEMQNYINAKFRILQNQTPADAFIFWEDDPVITAQLRKFETEARLYPFAENRHEDSAAWVDKDGKVIINTPEEDFEMPRADLSLHGLHNLFNSMAAGLSACLLDIRKDSLRDALANFEGVEHRLEPAGELDGVRWINDSKATNVNSCWYALESMPDSKSTILILGGKDKGNDYSEILPLVKKKVKAIVAMGLHNEKIVDFFTGHVDKVVSTGSLDEAVETCRMMAEKDDTVLLSPCCASFDLFKSYEDRGRQFKEAVRRLIDNN